MNIGAKLKELRHKKDLTQEQLAEYLNVSVSAVSKWESEKTYPDITMLIPLANFFDVTVDELLGREPDKEKDISSYYERAKTLSNEGKVWEEVSLWREAVQKYPNDYNCLRMLAYALNATYYCGGDDEEVQKNAQEAINICERILRDCTDSNIRHSAISILVYTYSNARFPFANEEKAVHYALMAPDICSCKELLLEHAYFTENSKNEALAIIHNNRLRLLDLLCIRLYCDINIDNDDDLILACNTALKLWETLVEDGNYLFYHCRIQMIHEILARCYARRQNREATLKALRAALYHAEKYDSLPPGELHYTSKFISAATTNTASIFKNYTETNVECVRKTVLRNEFDFLRNDPEFIKLLG